MDAVRPKKLGGRVKAGPVGQKKDNKLEKSEFTKSSEGWFAEIADKKIEVHVPESDSGPDEVAIALVNEALSELEELKSRANKYFLEFIDANKVKIDTDTGLIFIHGGFTKDVVKLAFSFDEDTYGLWFVEFSPQPQPLNKYGKFWPISFGRQSW